VFEWYPGSLGSAAVLGVFERWPSETSASVDESRLIREIGRPVSTVGVARHCGTGD